MIYSVGPMDGARTLSPEGELGNGNADATDAEESRRSRRRRRRRRTFSEKIRHNHAAKRVRRGFLIAFLGAVLVAASMYIASNSDPYEPVPVAPAAGGPR
jgi:cytochrome c-type biogenesis protein CcmH/NrfG